MSLLCSGVSETPSLAWHVHGHVVIYNDGEYILVIKIKMHRLQVEPWS